MSVHAVLTEDRPAHVFDVIFQRRSVRDYLPGDIPPHTIRELIAAAVQAPSPMNNQDWSFLVIRDRKVLKKCSDLAKAHMLSKMGDPKSPLSGFREGLSKRDFNIFYNAPALVVICTHHGADEMAKQACCLAAQNLMLAACAEGFGSCWIGFAEDWLNTVQAQDFLGIQATTTAIAPIIIGRPKTNPPAPERRIPDVSWISAPAS